MKGRARGRPREFDEAEVLDRAVGVFSAKGFSGATLDDLAGATGLSRPSLYNAFGDKESVYRHALARFVGHLEAELGRRVVPEANLRKALDGLYRGALDVYFAQRPALGCFMFCTAPVEAITHDRIRADMRATIEMLDGLLAAKFRDAQDTGQFPAGRDPRAAAQVAQGVLHSIALRARAGEPRAALERMADEAVSLLCAD